MMVGFLLQFNLVFKKPPQVLAWVLLVPRPLPEPNHKVLPALEQALGLEGAQQPDVVVRGAKHQIDPDFTGCFSHPLQYVSFFERGGLLRYLKNANQKQNYRNRG